MPEGLIDKYVKNFSPEIRKLLSEFRQAIKQVAPQAEEAIKYGMPTFVLNGKNLVHFTAFKNHIGFYPLPVAIKSFEKELSKFKTSKGAIQFPLDKPLPISLIKKMVRWRVAENKAQQNVKTK